MAAWSCVVLRVVAVRPQIRVVAVTTGPSKQETEGGGGGGVTGRGGARTKASSTLLFRPAGVEKGLGLGAGTATTVAEGPVGVIGAGAADTVGAGDGMPGDGAAVGGCTGAGAGDGGALHNLEGPAGCLQVSVHCDVLTRLTVEACTKF